MEFPQLDNAYQDEFGEIDADVYQIGRELWQKQARKYVMYKFVDENEGWDLMMRAIAKVSKYRQEHPSEIDDLFGYLFTTFKHFISAKLKQDANRQRILDEYIPNVKDSEEIKLLQEIEIKEILQKFTDEEQQILVLHHLLNYDYEEIAPKYGLQANSLRSKMSRAIKRIRKKLKSK